MCIYTYTYIHTDSPIPAIAYQGLVRPYGSQLLELWPPRAFQNYKMVKKRTPIQEQFMRNQCWREYWCLLGELHQIQTNTTKVKKSAKWWIHRDSNLKAFL